MKKYAVAFTSTWTSEGWEERMRLAKRGFWLKFALVLVSLILVGGWVKLYLL